MHSLLYFFCSSFLVKMADVQNYCLLTVFENYKKQSHLILLIFVYKTRFANPLLYVSFDSYLFSALQVHVWKQPFPPEKGGGEL